ncbi:tetratricopeptide repeat protein [Streptomyces sp. NPDC005925]|uniref:tetratricopeptide repeat protein n=1 Tax=Streptomyces sp. NPDC005925 TaxID=3157172 RepID=UPI0033CF5820
MEDVGALFTDQRAALQVAQRLLDGDGQTRVLVFTGLSGMGKSTLLARIATHPQSSSCVRLLDAASLRAGMAAKEEGGDQAALELLRQVGAALSASAPWWRRRWVRQQAEAIGIPRAWKVRVWQWASRGGKIANSPVTVTVGTPTQGERREGWIRDLRAVARAVRRQQCVLLIDTCEWLMYFDDIQAEQPRPGESLGVGAWFAKVLEQAIDEAPRLRVVLAGTAVPDAWQGNTGSSRYEVHELTPWKTSDTSAYLSRRGLPEPDGLAKVLTDRIQGLPVEISWIADALTGTLLDDTTPDGTLRTAPVDIEELAHDDRQEWLRTHVLTRISDRNRRLLHAAAVLGTFTPQALHTVAFGPALPQPAGDDDWFDRFGRMSCVRQLLGTRGHWELHGTIRDWLLSALTEDDSRRMPEQRTLPRLHKTAAEYHEALSEGAFSAEAAHHRFALGDDRHAAAWAQCVVRALTAEPVDGLYLQVLTDAALSAPAIRTTLPLVFADAHLTRAHLASHREDPAAAFEHAEHALAAYREADQAGALAAALIAGQAAWNHSRYTAAAAHWTSALDTVGADDPVAPELRCALAETVFIMGDSSRAQELLAEALRFTYPAADEGPPHSALRESERPRDVCHALPIPALADAIPARLRTAHLHRLYSEAAARLCEWSRSAEHADLALAHADGDPHITAQAHRLHAERALFTWDLTEAQRHVEAGFASARHCPDQRCMILLQLTFADLAANKARWKPSASASAFTSVCDASLCTAVPLNRTSETTTVLSLTERADAEKQESLAWDAVDAAQALASELGEIRILAYALVADDPTEALSLFCIIGDKFGQAHALYNLAEHARANADFQETERLGTEALNVFGDLGDRHGEAKVLNSLAYAARLQGDLQSAERIATEALELFSAVGDQHGQAQALRDLANTALDGNDIQTAERLNRDALSLFSAIGDRRGQAQALESLADTARDRDDDQAAEQLGTEALVLFRTVSDQYGEGSTLDALSRIAYKRGDYQKAERRAAEALEIFRALDDPLGQAGALNSLVAVKSACGDLEAAEQLGAEALNTFRTIGNKVGIANVLNHLADISYRRGDLQAAEQRDTAALQMYRSVGIRLGEANCLRLLGRTARAQGSLRKAEKFGTEALAIHRAIDDRFGQGQALRDLAETALALGDFESARSLLDQATAIYD